MSEQPGHGTPGAPGTPSGSSGDGYSVRLSGRLSARLVRRRLLGNPARLVPPRLFGDPAPAHGQ